MTPRERVRAALSHTQPDFTPCDYYATPEIHAGLMRHFGLGEPRRTSVAMGGSTAAFEDGGVAERLGVDIRYINPPYIGPPLPSFDDGSSMNFWGIRRRPMPNEYGEYAEPVGAPYAAWTTVEEAERFPGPVPIGSTTTRSRPCVRNIPIWRSPPAARTCRISSTAWRSAAASSRCCWTSPRTNPVYLYIVERRHRFYMAYIERILTAAKGRIDLVACGDDFGSQRGPLISPASFDRLFAGKKKELFDLAHAFGAKISHHCCGSSRALIPRFIAVRHGCAADHSAAGRRNESLRSEAGIRREDRPARGGRRARLAATGDAGRDRGGSQPLDGRSRRRRRIHLGPQPSHPARHAAGKRAWPFTEPSRGAGGAKLP